MRLPKPGGNTFFFFGSQCIFCPPTPTPSALAGPQCDSSFVMLSLNRAASSWPSACAAAQNSKPTDEEGQGSSRPKFQEF